MAGIEAQSDLSISVMQIDDLPDVMRIERSSYDFPWSEQIIRDCIKVGYHTLVLREDNAIRAYAFSSSAAGESHILNICVDPAHRGEGYAKALLRQSIATVMVHGAKVIFLEVRESNRAAISLYESMGFVEIGRRENYYRRRKKTAAKPGATAANTNEDALVMSRDLTIIENESDL